jgi:flavodoxin
MKTLIVYDSLYGNTQHIAQAIAATLGEGGLAPMVAAQDLGILDVTDLDLLVVGGPTQRHGISPELRAVLDAVPAGALGGVAAAAFDTRLRAARLLTGSAASRIARTLEQKGARLVLPPESFLVTHRDGPLVEDEATRACGWAARVRAASLPTARSRP